jgi:hypothetical protein
MQKPKKPVERLMLKVTKKPKSDYQVPPKQKGAKTTADSTAYFKKSMLDNKAKASKEYKKGNVKASNSAMSKSIKANDDKARQAMKGRVGYDSNGYRIKKK